MANHLIAIIDQFVPYQATKEQEASVYVAFDKQKSFIKKALINGNVKILYLDNYRWAEILRPMHIKFNEDLDMDIPTLDDKNIQYYLGAERINQVHIIGGNVTACVTNKELPFNYFNFIKDRTHIVLDICYDYSIEMQDKMLNLCMWCNVHKINYTSSDRALAKIEDKTYHNKLGHYPY